MSSFPTTTVAIGPASTSATAIKPEPMPATAFEPVPATTIKPVPATAIVIEPPPTIAASVSVLVQSAPDHPVINLTGEADDDLDITYPAVSKLFAELDLLMPALRFP